MHTIMHKLFSFAAVGLMLVLNGCFGDVESNFQITGCEAPSWFKPIAGHPFDQVIAKIAIHTSGKTDIEIDSRLWYEGTLDTFGGISENLSRSRKERLNYPGFMKLTARDVCDVLEQRRGEPFLYVSHNKAAIARATSIARLTGTCIPKVRRNNCTK